MKSAAATLPIMSPGRKVVHTVAKKRDHTHIASRTLLMLLEIAHHNPTTPQLVRKFGISKKTIHRMFEDLHDNVGVQIYEKKRPSGAEDPPWALDWEPFIRMFMPHGNDRDGASKPPPKKR